MPDSSKQNYKARYTSGACEEKGGYVVAYADLQELNGLDAKIQRAKTAVQSCIDIGTGCLLHARKHSSTSIKPTASEIATEDFLLEVYTKEMQRRLASLQELEAQTKSTLDLVSSSFRLSRPVEAH